MTDPAPIRIASAGLSAEISPHGAELQWVQDGDGRDLLWNGDRAYWTGRAPILFPVIGVVAGGEIRVDGQAYPMAKHGFARQSLFAVAEQGDDQVTFRLKASAATRASYPFDFRLDIRFACQAETLELEAVLHNPGDRPLPASFGFHPALLWPLPFGGDRAEHRVEFAQAEPAPIRRIDRDGLLRPAPEPSPVEGDGFLVRDDLFRDDALIFDQLASRSLHYGVPGRTRLRVDFPAMPLLGIWTKPEAGFLCIEPWQGIADPEGFTGEFRDKPGVIEVAPGGEARFVMTIAVERG